MVPWDVDQALNTWTSVGNVRSRSNEAQTRMMGLHWYYVNEAQSRMMVLSRYYVKEAQSRVMGLSLV